MLRKLCIVFCGTLVALSVANTKALNYQPPAVMPVKAGPVEKVYSIPPGEQVPSQIHEYDVKSKGDVEDWGHKNIGLDEAWKKTKGKGAIVAILDTGCDLDHPDMHGRVKAAKDFTGSRSGTADVNGHGTHCAGVVAAAEDGAGMIGVAPECQLLIGKVLNDRGFGGSNSIANGIDWAVSQGAHVISMSLGSDAPDEIIHAATKRAKAAGVIVIAAAGNAGPRDDTVGWPGAYEECICVAATDSKDAVASFSSRGKRVDVAAPGVNVRSTYPGSRYATMSGTSMATPYVAGSAALYVSDCLAKNVKPSPDDFRKAIADSSKDLPPVGKDNATGYGLIQLGKLVARPEAPSPELPPRKLIITIGFKPGELTDEEWATLQRLLSKIGTIGFEFQTPKQ